MTEQQAEQERRSDRDTWSGRTCLEHSVATRAKTSRQSSKKSSASQMKNPMYLSLRRENGRQPDASWATISPSLGECLMPNTGECPKEESVSTLSQILEETPHQKYYLSEKACLGILRRAEKRGKELPEILRLALIRQAQMMSSAMTSATDWAEELGITEPTQEDIDHWREVFRTQMEAMGESKKEKTDNQICKWLKDPESDSAKYKMWGNGIALPCAMFVMEGIAMILSREDTDEQK